MGIESDRLVFDYLSRVGDLAQQRQLPSGERMRLVAELRGEIERRRAKVTTGDGPAVVRRILGRLGTPDEVVAAAGARAGEPPGRGSGPQPSWEPGGAAEASSYDGMDRSEPKRAGRRSGDAGADAAAGAPGGADGPARSGEENGSPDRWRDSSRAAPSDGSSPGGSGGPAAPAAGSGRRADGTGPVRDRSPWSRSLRRMVPRPRSAQPPQKEAGNGDGATGADAPSAPHLAGTDELGPAGSQPDWWRTDAGPLGGVDLAPGFTGGVEIAEILRPPAVEDQAGDKAAGAAGTTGTKDPAAKGTAPSKDAGGAEAADGTAASASARHTRGLLRLLLRRHAGAAAQDGPAAGKDKARRTWTNPLLLLAAALLVAGAVLGNWVALALGWIIAYASRRLTPAERKWGVLGLPVLALAAGFAWLWGRQNGRWGDAIAEGRMNDAVAQTWPWVVRGAAVATAAFVVWRSQSRRP